MLTVVILSQPLQSVIIDFSLKFNSFLKFVRDLRVSTELKPANLWINSLNSFPNWRKILLEFRSNTDKLYFIKVEGKFDSSFEFLFFSHVLSKFANFKILCDRWSLQTVLYSGTLIG